MYISGMLAIAMLVGGFSLVLLSSQIDKIGSAGK